MGDGGACARWPGQFQLPGLPQDLRQGAVPPNERAQNLKLRQQEQQSILDFGGEDAGAILRKLNGRDRQKLDPYLTGVHEIEQGIERAERIIVANPVVDGRARHRKPGDLPPVWRDWLISSAEKDIVPHLI